MLINKKIFLIAIFIFIFTISAQITLADCSGGSQPCDSTFLSNPLGDGTTPAGLIGTVIKAVLGIVGSLALAMFIYSGLIWMTAAGNQERVTKGKNILIWATIGLAVIFSAYAMVRFVFTGIGVDQPNSQGAQINYFIAYNK